MPLLHDILDSVVTAHGSRIAFDESGHEMRFDSFAERVDVLAGALEELDVIRGDRLAILAPNSVDYLAYHYATASLGVILTVLNTRHVEPELVFAIRDAEACGLVIHGGFRGVFEAISGSCPTLRFSVSIGEDDAWSGGAPTTHTTEALVAAGSRRKQAIVRDDKLPAVLIYTSGTTGRPKGALQTHEGSTAMDQRTVEMLSLAPDDAYLAFMPYFHQAGLVRSRATLQAGARNVIPGKLTPETIAEFLIEKEITFTMLVPPYDGALRKAVAEGGPALPRLRYLLGGGGAGVRHARQVREFCEAIGCRFLGVYGQTEVTGVITIIESEDYFDRPESCGRPLCDIDVELWDDAGRVLRPKSGGSESERGFSEVGEIMARSRRCVPGYWNRGQDSKALYSGEWLHTGDLGKWDTEGFLYFVSRKKELIKTGGENVYPSEVEAVLRDLPGLRDLVVLGLPDRSWGEAVTAVLVPAPGVDFQLEDVQTFCRGKLAGYKIPKRIHTLESIPRNHTGKPLKTKLAQKLTS